MYRGVPIKKNNYKGVSYSKFLAILSVSNFLYYGFSFVFFTFFCPPLLLAQLLVLYSVRTYHMIGIYSIMYKKNLYHTDISEVLINCKIH